MCSAVEIGVENGALGKADLEDVGVSFECRECGEWLERDLR